MLSYPVLVAVLTAFTFACCALADKIRPLDSYGFQKTTRKGSAAMSHWKQGNEVGKNGCPNIVSRVDWKARRPKASEPMKTPVPFVIIHHTDTDRCTTYEDCCANVREIQNFHMDVRGWNDIGYTFLAGEDGNMYEGRGWDTVGAHCPWYNSRAIGISVMGDFSKVRPSKNATDAVQVLIQCAVDRGKLSPHYILYGHRQGRNGTDCPGDAFFKEIQSWPHWKPGDHFPPNATSCRSHDKHIQ